MSNTRLDTVEGSTIFANITATSRNAGTSRGNITKIRTISGQFSGSVSGLGFVASGTDSSPGIFTNGNLAASVNMLAFSSSACIRAGAVLSGTVTLPTNGLAGQITPNALNATSNAWTGNVVVGSTTINPGSLTNGAYTNTSASLGNGAIGLAPYRLHHADSSYTLGAIPSSNSESSPIVVLQSMLDADSGFDLVFYGPVVAQSSGSYPLYVYKSTGDTGTEEWCDITHKTTQTVAPTSPSDPRNPRTIRVRAPGSCSFPLGTFRITNRAKPVAIQGCEAQVTVTPARCAGTLVTPTPPELDEFRVWIKVVKDCDNDGVLDAGEENGCGGGGPCVADLDDGSGTGTPDAAVTVDDLLYFLVAFENGDPDADIDSVCGGGTPDSAVTVEDLLYFLLRFEAGC